METATFYEQTANDREVMTRVRARFMNDTENMFIGVGWTPLIVEMEQRLSAIDPDYALLSVVDRDGRMCVTFDASRPSPFGHGMTEDEWVAAQMAADERQDDMTEVAYEVGLKSMSVCEMTGLPGSPVEMDGQTYILSPAAAAYYAELDAADDYDVSFDFPEFTVVFEFDGEPAESSLLSEVEVRTLALLGRPDVEVRAGMSLLGDILPETEDSGITVGYLDYEEYEGVITLGGIDYTVGQVAEFVAAGIPKALRVSLDNFLRDTQNPPAEA